jgi:antitoxin (DNA-binding transcriptional repressor) of toxin-antitoxin stability system
VIARAGKPVARLTALKAEKRPIVFGLLEGQGWIADDFNAPLPEDLQAAFEGR